MPGNMTPIDWLLSCEEPWTRYRTLVDLLGLPEDDDQVEASRQDMLAHPAVQGLIQQAATWPGYPLKRHNDSGHPLHLFGVLADLGVRHDDPGVGPILDSVLAHQSSEGAFETVTNVSTAYGGSGEDAWSWMPCDAPVLLGGLLGLGRRDEPRVERAIHHLVGLVHENGWRCDRGETAGKSFRGPGRKGDPCPIATVYALRALATIPEAADSAATRAGVAMLLGHWERGREVKHYLFGVGTDYRKLKYPFVWYDILHVADTLSRFPFARSDDRFTEMVAAIAAQADEQGRFTAGSAYRAWKDWPFADKRHPSPWLTLLASRLLRHAG